LNVRRRWHSPAIAVVRSSPKKAALSWAAFFVARAAVFPLITTARSCYCCRSNHLVSLTHLRNATATARIPACRTQPHAGKHDVCAGQVQIQLADRRWQMYVNE